ALSLLSFEPS
ncbi:unnamed protein product, partial [Allacma fusca]